ncbi:ABC transporter substrate-binding protein [Paenibacillus hodogayensis]|uniref:ABC transporter substrate-binding protein n=1 Tax=Paenibacillus hodogayensis TaxID=279208 RepID=A0ABV5VTG9_9BACL
MVKRMLTIHLLLLVLLLAACSSAQSPGNGQTASGAGSDSPASYKKLGAEPLKLSLYTTGATFTDIEFATMIADPIHKKYPNVTIERIQSASNATATEVLSTYTPDLIFGSMSQTVIRTGVYEDLRELIKRHKFDESRLKPVGYDYIKDITKGKGDAVLAIPFNINQHIMYYNKDIFDKFGVPYPTAQQLTWDQAVELGAKLTRTVNGIHYIGLVADNLTGLAKSLENPVLDRQTGNAAIDTPDWRRVFELQKKIFDTPGYITADKKWNWTRDHFMKDQIIGMRVSWLANMVGPLEELRQQGVEFNWDIAPTPTFPDKLGSTRGAQIHALSVNSKSKHKDEAFQVIAEILSDDGQRILARNGRVPAVVTTELQNDYGLDIPVLKGKQVQNVFIGKPLQEHFIHPYESNITVRLTEAAEDLAINGLDVNSAVRKASEAINKDVATLRTTLGEF